MTAALWIPDAPSAAAPDTSWSARWLRQLAWVLCLLTMLSVLGGCATTGNPASATPSSPSPADPWESFNRKVWNFNDAVDNAVLKPLAESYRAVVPELVRSGVTNVFGNIGDLWSAANHLLQGKLQSGLEMGLRVMTNTVFGLGGLLDPASEMGLTRRSEDFGQTLGRWGVGSGPFLVLPLLGPSTVRDAAGLTIDRQASASTLVDSSNASVGISALELVNLRADLLATTRLLDGAALDKYSFVRDAFLARRLSAVYDGSPPVSSEDLDPGDSAPPPAKAPQK